MHDYISLSMYFYIGLFYISATFDSIGNALAVAESGVFNESETKVYLTISDIQIFVWIFLNTKCIVYDVECGFLR